MSDHATSPDSKVASITCPAMHCRNVESWRQTHIHIMARNLNFKSLKKLDPMKVHTNFFSMTWIQPRPTGLARHAHFFLCRNPAWPKGVFGLWNFSKWPIMWGRQTLLAIWIMVVLLYIWIALYILSVWMPVAKWFHGSKFQNRPNFMGLKLKTV